MIPISSTSQKTYVLQPYDFIKKLKNMVSGNMLTKVLSYCDFDMSLLPLFSHTSCVYGTLILDQEM